MAEQNALERYKVPIIIGGGAGLIVFLLRPRGAGTAPAGDVSAAGVQSAWNTLANSVQSALAKLREEYDARFAQTEARIAEQEESIAGIETQTSMFSDMVQSLVQSYEALVERVGALEERPGYDEAIKQQMLTTAKSFFLSLEQGSQSRKYLKFLKNYVIKQLTLWKYPEDVIEQFKAWVDPHIEHSVTGVMPAGFEGGINLNPFYDAVSPILDRAFDYPLDAQAARSRVRGRYGLMQ